MLVNFPLLGDIFFLTFPGSLSTYRSLFSSLLSSHSKPAYLFHPLYSSLPPPPISSTPSTHPSHLHPSLPLHLLIPPTSTHLFHPLYSSLPPPPISSTPSVPPPPLIPPRIANVIPNLVTSPDMSDVTESQPDVTTDLVCGSPPTWVSEGGGGGGELGH
ncbi:hypothetical protein Pcinc_008954 [Petrolisthes cinctipes]|uniref:Uncharacterized protein n=1 Tax=Petrolisthes cinctipes TaxID=88211 RepID=A0AAE1KYZ2_PETCI|nr:hypothetical protein Pcinc_008954 [Petrolisthes cinctipes]